ncbi:hypothetical protein RN001_001633 [Aquatica leii]|uniref:Uncharacterized protein n=1 Tax=Aquatica leii TaxID=1421715 RepID=A0AAN7SJN7_9COLE|nr:hypothetical protein RN001_001633 [Aquatica leii]
MGKALALTNWAKTIYTPTLWYFNSMFFLLEHCQVRTAVDSLTEEVIPHVTSQDSEIIEYVIRDDSELQDVDSIDIEPEVVALQPASPNQATLKGKKRKLQEEVVETKLIREASSCLASINENLKKTSSSNNEDEALSKYIITRLNKINNNNLQNFSSKAFVVAKSLFRTWYKHSSIIHLENSISKPTKNKRKHLVPILDTSHSTIVYQKPGGKAQLYNSFTIR